MNNLQFETSPYLIQHKDNPVDWFSWGDEAFDTAKKNNKPILLSIGYSACHWCHVMAHESFENSEIAGIMNENFINIKVDREERPDVDNIYMNFVQLTTGSGGWPLTVFLTPDLVPFYGGTYFPPEDRYGRPGFPKLLKIIAEAYKTKHNEIENQKETILEALSNIANLSDGQNQYSKNDFDKAFTTLMNMYDEEWGGFSKAPKFPASMALMFLLRYYLQTENTAALDMAEHSLQKMASGGIYDQIGGGFHRYSTDAEWLTPHFEKMLYDNALMTRVYVEAYQLTHNDFYLSIAEDIIEYILREMKNPEGGFYSAQDADSEGEEGKYFVWSYSELKKILTADEFNIAVEFFGISEAGNFEDMNILTAQNSISNLSAKLNIKERELINKISGLRIKLFEIREKRVKPDTDDKVIISWNALALTALIKVYSVTTKDKYLKAALELADFIWEKCYIDNILYHNYKDGSVKVPGFLDDYSFTAEAFLFLYEVTFDESWIIKAETLVKTLLDKFYDSRKKDFFYTSSDSGNLIVRTKDIYDNAMPSGNSSVVFVLLRLSNLLNNQKYRQAATDDMSSYHDSVIEFPISFSYMLSAAYFNYNKPRSLVVISKDELTQKSFMKKYFNDFLPFTILAGSIGTAQSPMEIIKDKQLMHSENSYYVCEDFICKAPVSSYDEMKTELMAG